MLKQLNWRTLNIAAFLGTIVMMLVARYYFQGYLDLEPCNLCIFQRIATIAVGLLCFVAIFVHKGKAQRWVIALAFISAIAGLALAGYQVWLQNLPPERIPACGPSLDYLLDIMGPWEAVVEVFRSSGSCAEVQWSMLGLSIPGWTGLAFVGYAAFFAVQFFTPNWNRK